MVKTAKASAGYQGPEIEDGLYKLELRNVTLIPANGPNRFDPSQPAKDQLRLMFRIDGLLDEEGEEVFVEPLVNNSLSDGAGGKYPASTYYKVCIALGLDPEQIEYGVDSDDLIGLWCQGMIVTAEEGGWPRVTQYTKLPKGGAKNAARTRQEAPQPSLEEEVEITAWFRKWTNKGHERSALVELSEGNFGGRAPGELTAEERGELERLIV